MYLSRDRIVSQIIPQLRNAKDNRPIKIAGTWGSFAPLLALHIQNKIKKPLLYISPYLDDADNVVDDLITLRSGSEIIEILPGWAGEEFIDTADETAAARARLVLKLFANKGRQGYPDIISASVQSLMQPVPGPDNLLKNGLSLKTGETITMEQTAAWLADNGFESVGQVDLPGQFAKRGGIIDIFAPVTAPFNQPQAGSTGSPQAIRIEFFGDSIESIRTIDLDTQLSINNIDSITITSALAKDNEQMFFLEAIDPDTIIFIEEPVNVQEVADVFLHRVEKCEGLYHWGRIFEAIGKFKKVFISRFASEPDCLELRIKSTGQFEHKSGPAWAGHKEALQELIQLAETGWNVHMYCETEAEVKRLKEIISQDQRKLPANFHPVRDSKPERADQNKLGRYQKQVVSNGIHLPIGLIHHGFIIESTRTIIATHHELFGQSIVRRITRPIGAAVSIDSPAELNKGDYVVHISYGIGKFRGIETIEKDGVKCEFLTLQYADKVIIHVPAQNIGLVQKYTGTGTARPQLSKIGTKKWERQKKKVAAATAELAAELLETQARRQSAAGITFGKDTNWQREFEESFLYQETPDQITACEAIKADMQKPVPMDRLLCGDVGYGKTELAMRAAFKAVESGKQVAVLVPTTVLCIQHERTFTQRFTDFPIVIESVNRFRTKIQAADILSRCRQGKVDILIGTHRLLSKDVGFSDLGLLIIDEEQRFGVEHKEKLKKMKINVDVLTLTATPIPRTLHMALLGLRDISSLATAPLDRRAVVTHVRKYDNELIKRAVITELNRQGQVFFVHNRVRTIEKFADEIQEILPEVKIEIAHGQMPKNRLEKAMIDFVLGKIDLLLCSAIIESGIDIPNANTIIVNDADRFGLAQLHQLRGRVGRFKYRAFAYFLLPRARTISPVAVKRLKAIEEYSQLGAGFKIALRDLEIRGAGNILGPEQSGHINTVGYELFCRLLGNAVKKLKNEPVEKDIPTVVDLGFAGYIPRNYIPSDSQRMNVYRQIALAKTAEDLERLTDQMHDMFGPVNREILMLIDLAEIRILASEHQINSITKSGRDLVFALQPGAAENISELFDSGEKTGTVRMPDPSTVHLRLEEQYFEPGTLFAILRKILRKKGKSKL